MWKTFIQSMMGRVWSHFHHDKTDRELTIHVTTGDRKRAGTDANVWLILHDEKGQSTDCIKLGRTFKNDHERGETCTFSACSGNGFGLPFKAEFWRDSFGIGHNWFLEKIVVEDKTHGTQHIFPVNRWIRPERHYIIHEYDCCLPQEDEHQEQRRRELKEYRRLYQYSQHIEDGPSQIKQLPEDEQFTEDYKWDIVKCKGRIILDTKLIRWTTVRWESICDLKKCYKFSLGEPACLEYWNEDRWFGLQRVQGVNPVLIKLCTEIPENFGVTSEMVEPFLEDLTLENCLATKRIFIVDLAVLEDIECKDSRLLCAPLALFFLNRHKELMPIAIQLFQESGPDNPVFLPSDPPTTWLTAKMYFNNADASFHQSCTHLGFTHLLMEGVVICTHRNLSNSHPLFKLLAPHFLFLLAINTRGLEKLISPGGWVDKTMTVGREGMFNLIKKCMKQWHMNVHGMVPNEIKSRKVESNVLPHYPYRDDAMLIYLTIRKYVSKVVHRFYDSDDKVINDYELQQWRSELVKDRKLGGCGLLGVPGETNNRFTDTEEVVDTMTSIISTCSLAHAAANFQQYDEYAFPPNYPGLLHGEPPRTKDPLPNSDILNRIPNKETTLDIMVITKLLSTKATKSLGDFESQFMFHPSCVQASKESPNEFKISLDKKNDNIQPFTPPQKEKISTKESIFKRDVKLSHFQKQKDLNQIMKLEAIQEKNAAEIEAIWKQYHQVKDGVYAVLPREAYEMLHTNLTQFPVFLFPLPRAQGYEFVMCQYLDQSCYFTSLVNYQAFKENAPVCLTVTYFTEFISSKGIVLMRGEYDNNALKASEAQCLTNQLQLYYGNKDGKELQLVEQFNKYPSTFKHMDLVANFEYSLGN